MLLLQKGLGPVHTVPKTRRPAYAAFRRHLFTSVSSNCKPAVQTSSNLQYWTGNRKTISVFPHRFSPDSLSLVAIMIIAHLLSLIALCSSSLVSAHTVVSYPGWRGDNLISNETFPYGMQWMYPCGGMTLSRNRTLWPVGGGALAIQPGWFPGHSTAFFYVNIGFGTDGPDHGPFNMTNVLVPVFQITGPSKGPYSGEFCLPQIYVSPSLGVKIGDNATLQIIEVAQHGASLYNCVDITFADPKDVAPVNETNCQNSTFIGFNDVWTTVNVAAQGIGATATSAASTSSKFSLASLLPIAAAAFWIVS